MPLYQNVANYPLEVTLESRSVVVRPTNTINLDSSEIELCQDVIVTRELQPVPMEPLKHNDSEANLRFVEKLVEMLELCETEDAFHHNLEAIEWRNTWLKKVSNTSDALTIIKDTDDIVVYLEQDKSLGPKVAGHVRELRERWEARRNTLRKVLIPTAWERILLDESD